MKPSPYGKALLMCSLVALLITPVLLTGHFLVNNLKLGRLQVAFAALPHPPGTTKLKHAAQVGHLVGNGRHCDFFVGELRSYTGNKTRIENFYSKGKTSIRPENKMGREPVQVVFLDGRKIPVDIVGCMQHEYYHDYQDSNDWAWTPNTGKLKLYIVFVMDVGTDNGGCDVRCL